MQLTYDEIIDVLDLKDILKKRTGYSLNPVVCEVTVLDTTLKFILPDNVKLSFTIGDIRLKSISKTIKL